MRGRGPGLRLHRRRLSPARRDATSRAPAVPRARAPPASRRGIRSDPGPAGASQPGIAWPRCGGRGPATCARACGGPRKPWAPGPGGCSRSGPAARGRGRSWPRPAIASPPSMPAWIRATACSPSARLRAPGTPLELAEADLEALPLEAGTLRPRPGGGRPPLRAADPARARGAAPGHPPGGRPARPGVAGLRAARGRRGRRGAPHAAPPARLPGGAAPGDPGRIPRARRAARPLRPGRLPARKGVPPFAGWARRRATSSPCCSAGAECPRGRCCWPGAMAEVSGAIALYFAHVVAEVLRPRLPAGARVLDFGDLRGRVGEHLRAAGATVVREEQVGATGREGDGAPPRGSTAAFAEVGEWAKARARAQELASWLVPGAPLLVRLRRGPEQPLARGEWPIWVRRSRGELRAGLGLVVPGEAQSAWAERYPQAFGFLCALEGRPALAAALSRRGTRGPAARERRRALARAARPGDAA